MTTKGTVQSKEPLHDDPLSGVGFLGWYTLSGTAMLLNIVIAALLVQSASVTTWQHSSVIKMIEEKCRHCPVQMDYSIKLDDGTVYVGQTRKKLSVALDGHTMFRFEKDGQVGDYIHILDDFGKDRRLRIRKKIAADKRAER